MNWILGIDGGGSRTTGYAGDINGHFIGEVNGGAANYQVIGLQPTLGVIRTLIRQCADMYNLRVEDLVLVSVGLAGVDRPADRREVLAGLQDALHCNILVFTDAQVALMAGLGHLAGIVLIAGTGSIAYGVNHLGQTFRAGGWGHLVSDEGSGYDLGRQAVARAIRSVEARDLPSALLPAILDFWRLKSLDDLIGYLYDPVRTKKDIAALAPVVVGQARQGDRLAQDILQQAGNHLAELVQCVVQQGFDSECDIRVAAYGSVLRSVPELQAAVRTKLQGVAQLIIADREPAFGALALAYQSLGAGEQFETNCS